MTRMTLTWVVLALSIAWLSAGSVAQAEPVEGTHVRISGRVTDSRGDARYHVTVTLTVAGFIESAASAETDDYGTFVFPAVSPNVYQLKFEANAFLPQVRTVAARNDVDIGTITMELAPLEDLGVIPSHPSKLPASLYPEKTKPRRASSAHILGVCDVLRQLKKLDGQMVFIRGDFQFQPGHGGWLSDLYFRGQPCGGISIESEVWRYAIWLESPNDPNLDGGTVSFSQEQPTLDYLITRQQHNAGGRAIAATLVGELRTQNNLTIVPAKSGSVDTMGNGYGIGGAFSAVLVVKSVRDIRVH